jgi:hypothetical protein
MRENRKIYNINYNEACTDLKLTSKKGWEFCGRSLANKPSS